MTITAAQNVLIVEGAKSQKIKHQYLYQEISARPFRRVFNLADYVQCAAIPFHLGISRHHDFGFGLLGNRFFHPDANSASTSSCASTAFIRWRYAARKNIAHRITEFDDVANALAQSFDLLKERDKHQKLLVDELNHRGRNMLTAIQAIAHQTRKQSKSLSQFGVVFEGRLAAMARSYSLLTRNNWRGGDLYGGALFLNAPASSSPGAD